MGKHNIGDDGLSYSLVKAMEGDEKAAKVDAIRLQRKLLRFMMHNSTHIGSLVGMHVIAVGIYYNLPAMLVGGGSH